MRIVFEEDDDEYFKLKRVSKFCQMIMLNMKVIVIEIKTYY